MLFVSFRFISFEPQHSKINRVSNPRPKNFKPWFRPAELTGWWEERFSLSFSLVLLSSNFIKRVRIQTNNLQISLSDTWMSCFGLFYLKSRFQNSAWHKDQTHNLKTSWQFSNTLSQLVIRCLNLNFSLYIMLCFISSKCGHAILWVFFFLFFLFCSTFLCCTLDDGAQHDLIFIIVTLCFHLYLSAACNEHYPVKHYHSFSSIFWCIVKPI